jgi:hypothetical protein
MGLGSSLSNCRRIRAMRLPAIGIACLVTVSSPLAAQLTVTNNTLPFGGVNQQYSVQLTASGGSGSYTWAITGGSPPPGVQLNSTPDSFGSSGLLSGAPTAAGAFTFTAQATDLQNPNVKGSKSLTIDVMQIIRFPILRRRRA